jgi:hypothetical protein
MKMVRYVKWKSLAIGAATFVAGHFVEVANWQPWFGGGDHAAWFLNDGHHAVLFMMACLFGAELVAGLLWAQDTFDAVVDGINVAAGAVVAMTLLLLTAAWGPGNLFPIAIVIGGLLLLLSTFIASMLVAAFKLRSTPSV